MNDLGRPSTALLAAPPPQNNLIDLRKIFGVVRRRMWWIVASVVLVFALSVAAYFIVTPTYTASASIALDRRVVDLVPGTAGPGALGQDLPTEGFGSLFALVVQNEMAAFALSEVGLDVLFALRFVKVLLDSGIGTQFEGMLP